MKEKQGVKKQVLVLVISMPVTVAKKMAVKNTKTNRNVENDENSENSKIEKKYEYLKSNLVEVLYIQSSFIF